MASDPYRQVVPRPSVYRHGPPAPWQGSPPRPPSLDVDLIGKVLDPVGGAPGTAAAAAAVLVPLVQRSHGFSVIFIRRATTLVRDPGLVAFPGGRRDPGESVLETALRESEEEIGLSPRTVTVLGALPPERRARDGLSVAAFVGVIDPPFAPVASQGEVEAILEVPFVDLYSAAWREIWSFDAGDREVKFFGGLDVLGDDLIWGLTAKILWDLLERVWGASTFVGPDR